METLQTPLLLVGEASFAFAAALSEKIGEKTRLLATCYQNEKDLYRLHAQSQRNVGIVLTREPLHRVRFGVDATRLETCRDVVDYDPRTILFNLPHVGGKSDIKKNRLLLKEFFISCSKLPIFNRDGQNEDVEYENHGEVWITLLNGQGGTGVDSPRRDWANSWQITSMAAEGGFVLARCFSYADSSLPAYYRTGFRGRDQSFQKQADLVVHVFERVLTSSSLPRRIAATKEERLGSGSAPYIFPSHVADQMDRFRRWPDSHPVRTLLSELLHSSGTEVIEDQVERDAYVSPLMMTENINLNGREYFLHAPDEGCTISNLFHLKGSLTFPGGDGETELVEGDKGEKKGQLFLRSCIIQSALKKFEEEKRSVIAHGDCYYQPALPDLNTFSYELCSISEGIDLFDFHIHRLAGVTIVPVQILPDGLDNWGKSQLPRELTIKKFSSRWLNGIIELEKYYTDEQNGSRIFGFEGRFARRTNLKVVLVDVSVLASRDHEPAVPPSALSRPSLFPPVWSHCLSFWECPGFDERVFVELALSFCGRLLRTIELVEMYEGEGGRKSRCYRLIHQSFFFPLTKSMSNSIQCALRTFLQEELMVELR